MTDQVMSLSTDGDSVLGRLPGAEETIRRVLRDADEMLRLHLVHDGKLPSGRSGRAVVYDLTDVALLALGAARRAAQVERSSCGCSGKAVL
jgi:hypothetical protein